jgi:hypothetical protein
MPAAVSQLAAWLRRPSPKSGRHRQGLGQDRRRRPADLAAAGDSDECRAGAASADRPGWGRVHGERHEDRGPGRSGGAHAVGGRARLGSERVFILAGSVGLEAVVIESGLADVLARSIEHVSAGSLPIGVVVFAVRRS